jgi:predicted ATPase/class 3 adenylate cyclase/sugar phosphate isomerase/epimerase
VTDLPTGTVTFLLTDIEGSTRLWEQHPDAMPAALAEHDGRLAAAMSAHGGVVVKSRGEGDSLFAVFARATDAVAAALDAQRALTPPPAPPPAARGEGRTDQPRQNWTPLSSDAGEGSGEGLALRVRMAIHTGEAELRDGDYYGTAVNRCARLRAIAHGGQVLLSQPAYALVRDHLPAGAEVIDLGEHRLRDLTRPEHVFQLQAPGLPAGFPPLRALDTHPHNLPQQPTPLVGREHELRTLVDLLRGDARLVTLTGPGGIGKTRLALQAAADLIDSFADGVFVVSLALVSDASLVAPAIAQTLGVREADGRTATESLVEFLRDRSLLLVLDNFEQVLDAASLVVDLLAACPGVRVLVTSRAVLRLRGEHEFPVIPLTVPAVGRQAGDSGARGDLVTWISQYEAVRLFIERARAARPGFSVTNETAPAVAEICARLDGLPLAIELAAARAKILSPQAMLARLDQRLKLLTGGARDLPARQQTLRDAIAWSYDLLTPAEQTLFRRLAVFAGGCTLEAAEAINLPPQPPSLAGKGVPNSTTVDQAPPFPAREGGPGGIGDILDGIASLVDKSLLRQEEGPDGEPRFSMLETIREFALDELERSGEAEAMRYAHARFFLALVEEFDRTLLRDVRQVGRALQVLDTEFDNLRAAFWWFRSGPDEDEGAPRLFGTLWLYWDAHAKTSEALTWSEAMLARRDVLGTPRTTAWARTLLVAGAAAWVSGDPATGRERLEEAAAIAREIGDRRVLGNTFTQLGLGALYRDDYTEARRLFAESAAILRTAGSVVEVAPALLLLGDATLPADRAAARASYEECIAFCRARGDQWTISYPLTSLGRMALQDGDYAGARAMFEEGLSVRRSIGDRWGTATSLTCLGELARTEGDLRQATAYLTEALTVARETGIKAAIAWALHEMGHVALAQGDTGQAGLQLAESLRIAREIDQRQRIAATLAGIAGVMAAQGQPARAARLFGAAAALFDGLGVTMERADRMADERDEAAARAALGDEAFASSWEAGRALTLEQAVDEALAATAER